MKALVKTKSGKGNVDLIDIKEPIFRDNELKVEVKYCGICGTDIIRFARKKIKVSVDIFVMDRNIVKYAFSFAPQDRTWVPFHGEGRKTERPGRNRGVLGNWHSSHDK